MLKVLFVPTAAIHTDSAREGIYVCVDELMKMGIDIENIHMYNLEILFSKDYERTYSKEVTNLPFQYRLLSVSELKQYDAIFFCGGDANILLEEMNRTGFGDIVRQAVEQGVFYVGISAGSMIGAGNFQEGLNFINNKLYVHCKEDCQISEITSKESIYLNDNQAVYVTDRFIKIIE